MAGSSVRISTALNIQASHFIASGTAVETWGIPLGNDPVSIRVNDTYVMTFVVRTGNRMYGTFINGVPPAGMSVTKLEFIR